MPAFSRSEALTLGIELELQIVGGQDYNLIGAAPDLLREMAGREHPGDVKPEITDSMIELSTDICRDYQDALTQLRGIRDQLVHQADRLGILLSGGGTHPFQRWERQAIFDAPRFQLLSQLYGYLAKQFTIFGQHVHIGCACPDRALWLLHAFSRYIPHLIALSAASPFVQGTDTGFQSARLNSVFAFPLSGRAPFVLSWDDFNAYYRKMIATGVVKSMKDFYWDIRPKPEFGTIELRVMDTPRTVERAAQIAAYAQALARYLLEEKPSQPQEDDYLVYTFNRFQACRFGYAGTLVVPGSAEQRNIGDDIIRTMAAIEMHAYDLGATEALNLLRTEVLQLRNGARELRDSFARENQFEEVVRQSSELWAGRTDPQ
ncbi:MAG: glutamate--cysteine ligase [Betaproteobacteria bacterium]|nr:glutamate--cysteine ligase [Betaproteobacteria bacterium]